MLAKLFTGGGGETPWPLVRLTLCRDVYHCRPSELAEEDWDTVQEDLICLAAEAKVKGMSEGKSSGKPRPRRP